MFGEGMNGPMNDISIQLSLSTLHNHLSRQQVLMGTQHHCLILVLEDSKCKEETWLLVSQKMHPMNLEPIIESKSERERKKSYSNAYIHNLEKWY